MKRAKPRILLYSHDTYGLGHLRRTLAISRQLAADIPGSHQLLLTGSMVAGAFSLPARTDMIKLPALSKRSSGEYKSRSLPLSLRQTLAWREQMILQAAINFEPDLLLVDKSPAGVHGELLPALRHLKTWSPETRLVLGMRDIEDGPAATRREWAAAGIPQLHEEVYDAILLYGDPAFFDPVAQYGMSDRAAARLIPCGYLQRTDATRATAVVRRELGLGSEPDGQPLVVVTVGGGGDGYDIIHNYLAMLEAWPGPPPFHSLLVTGPLMPQAKRRLLRRGATGQHLTLLEFTPDLFSYLAAADLVVGMAGYNTVSEILTLGQRALLIPRAHTRTEQRWRAELLAQRGLVHLLPPDALSPDRLATAVTAALAAPRPRVDLPLDGLARTSQAIANLLQATPSPLTLSDQPATSIAYAYAAR